MDICKKWFRLLALMGLITLTLPLAVGVSIAYGDGGDDQLAIPERTELKYPNLGSTLDRMVARVQYEGATSEEAAGEALVHKEESVAVTIYLSGNVADVVTFLEDNGGDPRNVGEDYIEAYVPVALLGASVGTARSHPGAGNYPSAAYPACPADYRTRPGGPWFGGLEPSRVQRAGRKRWE